MPVLLDGLRPSGCVLTPQQRHWPSAHREAVTSGDEMLAGAAEEVSAGAADHQCAASARRSGGRGLAGRRFWVSSNTTMPTPTTRALAMPCKAATPARRWLVAAPGRTRKSPGAGCRPALDEGFVGVVSPRRRLGRWQRERGSVVACAAGTARSCFRRRLVGRRVQTESTFADLISTN